MVRTRFFPACGPERRPIRGSFEAAVNANIEIGCAVQAMAERVSALSAEVARRFDDIRVLQQQKRELAQRVRELEAELATVRTKLLPSLVYFPRTRH